MRPKLPTQFSTEELLKALESGDLLPDSGEVKSEDTAASFMQVFMLKPGPYSIKVQELFKLYKLWCPESEQTTLPHFSHILGTYLPSHYYCNKRHVKINRSPQVFIETIEKYSKSKKRNKVKSPTFQSQFNLFLEQNNIKEGKCFVENYILYYIYNDWCRKTRKRAASRDVFCGGLDLHFERKSTNQAVYYGVDENIKSLISTTTVNVLRQGSRNHEEDKKKFKEDQTILYQENQEKSE